MGNYEVSDKKQKNNMKNNIKKKRIKKRKRRKIKYRNKKIFKIGESYDRV